MAVAVTILAAKQVKMAASHLPGGDVFAAVAHLEDAKEVQGYLLDALIDIATRLRAAGLPHEGILEAISKAVTELDQES